MTEIILLIIGVVTLAAFRTLRRVDEAVATQRPIAEYQAHADGRKAQVAFGLLHSAASHPPQGWVAP